jgi:hypothetical protein
VRRILRIEKDPRSSVELPRYQVTDRGRYGDEGGWADLSPLLTRSELGDFLAQERVSFHDIEKAFVELDRLGEVEIDAPPRLGPSVARALFDTVCNPLIEALEYELSLAVQHNWTFSFQSRTLELIKPYPHYISNRAWPNAEQFFGRFGALHAAAEHHDNAVEALQHAVASLFDILRASDAFNELCSSFFAHSEITKLGYDNQHEVFGAYSPRDYENIVAQHIVNHSHELQSYYSSARFWNSHRVEFLGLLHRPPIDAIYKNACERSDQLRSASERFRDQLKRLRGELSARLDVPMVVDERHPTSV